MNTEVGSGVLNVFRVDNFDPLTASNQEIEQLKSLIYQRKVVVLKNQTMSARQFLTFSQRLGEPEMYYQEMYRHPEVPEIFVSSNVPKDGRQVGVPRTGAFWHADYCFMPKPFAITAVYHQIVPQHNRGTYFIDMGRVYRELPDGLKQKIADTVCVHSPRRYVKIKPSDVYRPLIDILADIERETPEVRHPTSFSHPITHETILYVNAAAAHSIETLDGRALDGVVLRDLLEFSGQSDPLLRSPYIHLVTYEPKDVVIWDNRSLVHSALHAKVPEPTESYRITLHDHVPYYFVNHVNSRELDHV